MDDDKHKNQPLITVVLKVDRHCDGCATKITKCLRDFHGVEWVKADWEQSKITISGAVDAVKLRDKLAKTTMKQVILVSPLPKKEKNQAQPKAEKPKEPPVITVILKIKIHCDGCFVKIQKVIRRFKDVYTLTVDKQAELFTVKGVMDVRALQAKLEKDLKKTSDVVQPKKQKENSEQKENKKADQKVELPKVEYGIFGLGYVLLGAGHFVEETVHAPQLFSDENPNACTIM